MEWYNILITVVGAIGGTAGIISVYHAKSNKDTIDISNFHSLIEEEREERRILREEYEQYKVTVNKRVDEVKKRVEEISNENEDMISAILQGYRCTFPETPDDCPVIRRYKECKNCPKE